MSTKYHLGENGPMPCNAQPGKCPVNRDGSEHFDNMLDAISAYETKVAENAENHDRLNIEGATADFKQVLRNVGPRQSEIKFKDAHNGGEWAIDDLGRVSYTDGTDKVYIYDDRVEVRIYDLYDYDKDSTYQYNESATFSNDGTVESMTYYTELNSGEQEIEMIRIKDGDTYFYNDSYRVFPPSFEDFDEELDKQDVPIDDLETLSDIVASDSRYRSGGFVGDLRNCKNAFKQELEKSGLLDRFPIGSSGIYSKK